MSFLHTLQLWKWERQEPSSSLIYSDLRLHFVLFYSLSIDNVGRWRRTISNINVNDHFYSMLLHKGKIQLVFSTELSSAWVSFNKRITAFFFSVNTVAAFLQQMLVHRCQIMVGYLLHLD